MKEQLITYKTAVLATDKGADFIEFGMEILNGKEVPYIENCTQSTLQKWLREKHGICVYIDYKNMNLVICSLYKDNKIHTYNKWSVVGRDDLKELEEGLLESLKLIEL